MGFNSTFKGLNSKTTVGSCLEAHKKKLEESDFMTKDCMFISTAQLVCKNLMCKFIYQMVE